MFPFDNPIHRIFFDMYQQRNSTNNWKAQAGYSGTICQMKVRAIIPPPKRYRSITIIDFGMMAAGVRDNQYRGT